MSGINYFDPGADGEAPCPVCGDLRPHSPRYPRHLCADCVGRATDEHGRPLRFFNASLLGTGFEAQYADTGKPRDSHVCFVDGVRCWADEARFGGIVVQPVVV